MGSIQLVVTVQGFEVVNYTNKAFVEVEEVLYLDRLHENTLSLSDLPAFYRNI